MTYFNFDKLEDLEDGDILFLDELLNGNPTVLNACLTMVEQRRFISGKPLPNIMIVAAANPQGQTPITPQIKERFLWYPVHFERDMWEEFMMHKYNLPISLCSKLSILIKNETFTTNNFMTPRSVDKAVNMIIKGVPTPYSNIISPILDTLIENPFNEEVRLDSDTVLGANEQISWLKLISYKNKQHEVTC